MTTSTHSPRPQAIDKKPRCWRCNRLLANSLARPWDITCSRCRARNIRSQDESSVQS